MENFQLSILHNVMLFKKILRMTVNDGINNGGAIVRYEVHDEPFLLTPSGVYLIVQDGLVVYCGKFDSKKQFKKRWLYARGQYIYHQMRGQIAVAIASGKTIEVWAQSTETLKNQLKQSQNPWVSASSIEERIIKEKAPEWNKVGR